jgi:antirestriction protein ArdC
MSGLTVDQVKKLVDDFREKYNGNVPLRIEVYEKQEDLYLGKSRESIGIKIEGGYHPSRGFIALFAANMDNEEAVARTLRHEVLGHYGLNTFKPDEKRDLLDRILETRQEPTLSHIWQRVDKNYAGQSELLKAEEVFAFVAEDERTFAEKGWDKVRASFQKALRASGLSDRPLTLPELREEALQVAKGIQLGQRPQHTFPASDDAQFRIQESATMEPKKPFHETVAEKLIEQLKQGTAPWQKPWQPGEAVLPTNPTTENRYKGINAMWLMAQGYSDQRWMTYKQAQDIGAQVRKGEKGTGIQYWKFNDEQTLRDDNGKPVINAEGEKIKQLVKLERPRPFFATVFNAEQIDGLPPLQPKVEAEQTWTAQERAENILVASGAVIRHGEADRAFYRPTTDSIHLPEKGQFPSADNYYATALHELGHWTGHSSRLDRDLTGSFGSESYAKEELRAEIASMILGDELGIGHDPSQHAAYVGSWIKALQDDPLELFRAAADAEKIQGYVLGLEQAREQSLQQESIIEPKIQQIEIDGISYAVIHAEDLVQQNRRSIMGKVLGVEPNAIYTQFGKNADGRAQVAAHNPSKLDAIPALGSFSTINYGADGVGKLLGNQQSKVKEQQIGR